MEFHYMINNSIFQDGYNIIRSTEFCCTDASAEHLCFVENTDKIDLQNTKSFGISGLCM